MSNETIEWDLVMYDHDDERAVSRFPVPGGWIYESKSRIDEEGVSVSTQFVPDPGATVEAQQVAAHLCLGPA